MHICADLNSKFCVTIMKALAYLALKERIQLVNVLWHIWSHIFITGILLFEVHYLLLN